MFSVDGANLKGDSAVLLIKIIITFNCLILEMSGNMFLGRSLMSTIISCVM